LTKVLRGNPFFDRENPKDKGVHGRKAEKKTAKRLSGRLTPGSGALSAKGDFEYLQWLVENKATEAESLVLKLDWLTKIYGEALAVGREPALSIQFVTGDGSPRDRGAWVMIPEKMFRNLTGG